MDEFTMLATAVGLFFAFAGIVVAILIARRQGVFRNEHLVVTVAIPKLLPLNSIKLPFSRMIGPPGSSRLGSVYPILLKPPPCVAINISDCSGKIIFFLPIVVSNLGEKSSKDVELHLVTSNNLAAENVTEIGKIKNIDTKRREIKDLGELQISHRLGVIKKHDHELIGEVFALDLNKHNVEEKTIRVILNIAAHSEDSYTDTQVIIFLIRAESREDLMMQLAYQAKMEYKKNTSLVRRCLAFGRAFEGRPCMWVDPGYKSMPDGMILHQFERAGDKTEAGLLVPAIFGQFLSF